MFFVNSRHIEGRSWTAWENVVHRLPSIAEALSAQDRLLERKSSLHVQVRIIEVPDSVIDSDWRIGRKTGDVILYTEVREGETIKIIDDVHFPVKEEAVNAQR